MYVAKHLVVNEVHSFQADEHHDGGSSGQGEHARTSCHADGRCDPQTGSRGETFHHVLLKDDGSSTNEPNATDNLRGHSAWIKAHTWGAHYRVETMSRQDHEQCAAQSYEEVCAKAGFF